jgi:hypothetical protein
MVTTNGCIQEKDPTKRIPQVLTVSIPPMIQQGGVGRDVQQAADDHHLPVRQTPLHALLTSIEDYAEDLSLS